uniref:Uncharacterized protein n=1 Tax=Timema genevievae TaxID=629358 RepID=A0A7R9K0W2_TIMGE|nr:unnamed protein product [Timema genevievae]
MLEPEEAGTLLVLALLQDEKQKRRKPSRRKVWVHPLLQNRETGAFSQLYPQLLSHEDKFFNYFRMSRSSFEELHALIQHRIHKEDTIMRQAIPTQERLAITLRLHAVEIWITFACHFPPSFTPFNFIAILLTPHVPYRGTNTNFFNEVFHIETCNGNSFHSELS